MRLMIPMVAFVAISLNASALSAVPRVAGPDDALLVQVKMSHAMTCGEMMKMHAEMMKMHHKMMGAKKMTCGEMMRMHHKMMGGHA